MYLTHDIMFDLTLDYTSPRVRARKVGKLLEAETTHHPQGGLGGWIIQSYGAWSPRRPYFSTSHNSPLEWRVAAALHLPLSAATTAIQQRRDGLGAGWSRSSVCRSVRCLQSGEQRTCYPLLTYTVTGNSGCCSCTPISAHRGAKTACCDESRRSAETEAQTFSGDHCDWLRWYTHVANRAGRPRRDRRCTFDGMAH